MHNIKRFLTVVGLVGASAALLAGPASASAPSYGLKSGSGQVDSCDSHTSGGTNGRNGGEFIATTFSGAACHQSNVEFVFVDNWGNELAWHQVANSSTPVNNDQYYNNGWFASIEVSNSDFTKAIEVVGSSLSLNNNQTQPGVYLYY